MFRSPMFKAVIVSGALASASGLGACATSHAAAAESLAGTYEVSGTPLGGGEVYKGEVVVEKTGETYKVTWFPGKDQVEGIGILKGHKFSVGYLQNGVQGVAVYKAGPKRLKGVWSELGQSVIAPEDWTKR